MKIKLLLALLITALGVAAAMIPSNLLPQGGEAEVYMAGSREGGQYTGNMTVLPASYDECSAYMCDRSYMGMSVRYYGNTVSEQEIADRLCAVTVYRQEVSDMTCVYMYSPLLGDGVMLDGRVVNIQIAITQDCLTVGFPLIMGSY